MSLKRQFLGICDEYLHEFCRRHEFHFEDAEWIEVGDLVQIADYFFSFSDIRYDVDNNIEGDTLIEWYDYDLDVHNLKLAYQELECKTEVRSINYPSWCKGAPKPYDEEEMAKMWKNLKKRMEAKAKIANFVQNNIKSEN